MEKHQEDFEPVFEGISFSNIDCKGFPNSVTISNGKDLRNFETRDYVPLEALEEYVPLKTYWLSFCPCCGQALDWGKQ